jgi:acyl carrier protein
VTDPGALRAVRDAALREFGRLDGIVHAAGVADGGVTELRDRAAMMPVLAPKVAGTLTLAEVFGADDLDFVALFSSVVGTVGGFGEVDYCAANAFLDAYAESTTSWRVRPRSLAWAGWQGTGMLAALGAVTPTDALRRMTPTEGVAAFHRAIAAGPPGHVVVSPIPVDAIREQQTPVAGARSPDAAPAVDVQVTGTARNPEQAQLIEIWSAVLGVANPAPDDNFFELGGNSLVAVQLIAQVRQGFGVKLPMRSIFETPTIAGMAERVTDLRAAQLAIVDGPPDTGRTIARIPRRTL